MLLILSCLAPATEAAVQTLSPADQSIIENRQRALLEQAKALRESLQNQTDLPVVTSSSQANAGDACHPVKQIRFRQSAHLPAGVQAALARSWQNRCLTLAQINTLIRETTAAYLERGYITSQAWLPEQDISGGELIIAVSEGRIESVTLNGDTPLAVRMAMPAGAEQVLNLRDLEQGLEQLNRLRSAQVTIDIQPGTLPGYSRVVLVPADKKSSVGVSVSADNSGQKSTGTAQLAASLTVENPLHLADLWQFSASRDGEFRHDRRSRSLTGSVSIPYGYWLLSGQTGWNDFYQQIPLQQASYRYAGSALSQRFSVGRTLLRDGRQKLAFETALSRRRSENRLAGEKLSVSSPTITGLSGTLNYSRSAGGGWLTLSPSLSHGLHVLGATPDAPDRLGLPRSGFRKYSLSASYFLPLSSSVWYLTSFYGQTTPDNLWASERISVGGQYSVRGFKEQYLTGNRGAYWRNELTWQIASSASFGGLSLTGALDIGRVQKEAERVEGGSVAGAALGLGLSGGLFSQSVTVGKPLLSPDSLQPDAWVAWWQAGITF